MMREWARHLLAYEAVAATTSLQTGSPTFRVYEKLRLPAMPLVGVDGFQVLAARALKLAKSNAPSLSAVHITALGCLSGFGPIEPQTEPESDRHRDAGVIFIAHLFGLFSNLPRRSYNAAAGSRCFSFLRAGNRIGQFHAF